MIVNMPQHPCPFCKKNESTQLCDFIIDYAWTTAKDERGRMIGPYHVTCDNQMCKQCAATASGREFCPTCQKLHEHVQKNHVRAKGRLLADIVSGRHKG